jgi:hypothetical protein
VTELEAFRQRYRQAKRARGQKTKMAVAWRAIAKKAEGNQGRRAQLVLTAIEHGADRADAAAICGCTEDALRRWLHTRTGSTIWPPLPANVVKITDMAGK